MFIFFNSFYSPDKNSILTLLLLGMALPLQILYSFVIWFIQKNTIQLTVLLIVCYVSFAILQVSIRKHPVYGLKSLLFFQPILIINLFYHQVFLLLLIGYNLIHILWSYKINPDMSVIPIMTALGDLFGSGLLLLTFFVLEQLSDPNAVPSDGHHHGHKEEIIYNVTSITSTTLSSFLNATTF